MLSAKIIGAAIVVSIGLLFGASEALPAPDSAGMVEMVNGLAYGNIPYGSVSGNLASGASTQPRAYYVQQQQPRQQLVLVPDTRTIALASPVLGPINPVGY